MANLYELTQSAAYLQQLLEDGDIDEQTYADSLEGLMIGDKVENICKVIRNLEASASAFKAEKERLAQRQKALESGIQRLKDSLVNYMLTTTNKKITAGLFTVSLGASKSVEVYQQDQLPDCFLKPQPPTVDKTAIGAALKAGEEVPGAKYRTSNYVTIR